MFEMLLLAAIVQPVGQAGSEIGNPGHVHVAAARPAAISLSAPIRIAAQESTVASTGGKGRVCMPS
ncbi:hypothetical protein LIX60_24895 [Streptomyces sp. S07_1.15]|uniref:hypothetical protein n=1 Tax=Streptomyces sp. S07_1.15 TaxID=2873925 RepID=UPI001D13CEB6|nr:hypothetical protein [Streptomyces sp. S07_1.15]MCC3654645.1 hypothetical protein [Streptomyces sp. S07_1.15]